ncbi:MAG: hypothetical protein WBF53_14025 [Litorimonas sp.]
MAQSSTRRTLIRTVAVIGVLLIGGMLAMKAYLAKTVFFPPETAATEPPATVAATEAELDARERMARDMVTSTVSGTPVMPDAGFALDPSDYSRDLARFIPIDVGMERYLATDELLLYYNREPESGAKVSSSERMIDGATLFVIRRSGLADDSLAAEETFALFDAGQLVDFGSRLQCRRGANANQWTTELCP